MSAAAIAAIIGAGVAQSAGSIIGGQQAGGASTSFRASNYDPLLALENKYRPIDFSAGLQQLVAQQAYGLGADPESIALELMVRQVEATSNPAEARKIQRHIQALQTLTMQQSVNPDDPKLARKIAGTQETLNALLAKRGYGTVSLDNGQLRFTLADQSLQAIVDKARTDSAGILSNRLLAEQNLAKLAADFPMATAEDFAKLEASERERQNREVNERYGLEVDRILQQANVRGYNPAGIIGELEKQRTQDLFDTQFTATDRALQVLGGRQDLATRSIGGTQLALSPDRQIAILNALRGQQTPTTGQLAAAQLSAQTQGNIANAQSQGQGIASGASAISDAGTLIALLNRSSAQQNQFASSTGPAGGYSYSTDPLARFIENG